MNVSFTTLRRRLRGFSRDRRGNVAMMWALTSVALLSLTGIAVDFSRANAARQSLQNAADGAALVAERMADLPLAERQLAAEQYFRASLADQALAASATLSIVEIPGGGGHRATASMVSPTTLSRLISDTQWVVRTSADASQEGSSLEVALVLDITGSMAGQRIIDLRAAAADLVDIVVRDEQDPYFSKVALVPYSIGVNVGANAAAARGGVAGPVTITDATWRDGPTRTITGATRANPVVITSANHGFNNGDYVRITGVNGMTQLNNRIAMVANRTANTFQLSGVNGSAFSNYTSGGVLQKCFGATCQVRVTAAGHGFANNDWVVINSVSGMTQINNGANAAWQVSSVTANTFVLNGTTGPSYGTYTSAGQAFCTTPGCEYFRFTSASNATRVHRVSTCVTERVGANAYNDISPAVSPVGRNYPSTGTPCPGSTVTPLSSDKAMLTTRINALTTTGSTAGQIGVAWGWYMLSPNFAHLWTGEGRPLPYGSPNLRKIAVLMTDGEFNTPYCNGVVASNSGSGSPSTSERINCVATNGDPFTQARNMCTAMKNAGVTVYTVGFGLTNGSAAANVMRDCASSPSQAFRADNGAELRAAFRGIATAISQLRLSK